MKRPAADLALVVGASLRLTRFITSDTLGEWLIVGRLKAWGDYHEARHLHARGTPPEHVTEDHEPETWQARAVTALDCPFCIGFWLGAAVLASWLAVRDTRLAGPWRYAAGALTLNYVVGHTSARLD